MKLLTILVSCLAAFVAAQSSPNPITSPTGGTIQAGSATTITWTPTTQGTISLQLRSGSANNLNAGTTIASSIANSGSYTWTPDSSIASGSDYTIEIIDDSDTSQTNYSPMFSISSSGSSASSLTTGSTASQTSTPPTSLSSTTPSSSVSGSSTSNSASTTVSTTTSTSTNSSNTSTITSSSQSSSSSHSSSSATSSSSSKAPVSTSNAAAAQYKDQGIMAAVVGIGAVVALA